MANFNLLELTQRLNLRVANEGDSPMVAVMDEDVNRPGLQFAGFFDYFDAERIQIVGKSEIMYVQGLTDREDVYSRMDQFCSHNIACVIISRGMQPPLELLQAAIKHKRWIFVSDLTTAELIHRTLVILNERMQPRQNMHGVLMDVYGTGILMIGSSGIGKSETALELIKRGHRLVADDNVDIRKVARNRLVGSSPGLIRHFMEVRGIGIIDIRQMYGISATIDSKSIDLVVTLERWEDNKAYDRVGLIGETFEIMGVTLNKITIPVAPGRNLAIIIEVAAKNLRLKSIGYHAMHELSERKRRQMEALEIGLPDPLEYTSDAYDSVWEEN